ncbi:hypothetical protein [Flavobacterium sp. K5-23]|uniref:hypothetical protein n=1 Tax=Flavobacterium sp. K5-23 TaxID=2746225 RepID=UPI00200FC847|nr:hypothetical protein [Flavobacterium sp. K5-23]UQD56446.1 hypothetical protein FLAK523_08650 [Flavobacterium sp. K5-23]
MKNIVLGIAVFLFSFNIQSQNKNVKTEVKTTTTTIKDSEGEKKIVKTQEIQEIQKIELKDAESTILNKDVKDTPVQVTEITKITDNGQTRLIDVDHSAYYINNDKKYQVVLDDKGYNMYFLNGDKSAILRKTSRNNYIIKSNNILSFGYFDDNGNLVIETYDDQTDEVSKTTYVIIKD